MSFELNWPAVVFSSDIDWASEDCILDTVTFATERRVKPSIFLTHQSAVLSAAAAAGQIEVGLHPNFLPGSSHGNDTESVVEEVMRLAPDARGFRSHFFVDSTIITRNFKARGLTWDSNLCLHLQEGIAPLRHFTGLIRFPVFWADDLHMETSPDDWSVETVLEKFLSPGLKILDVHPIHLALNSPNTEFYNRHKDSLKTLTKAQIEAMRHKGPGVRTFLAELIKRLQAADVRFYNFEQLLDMFGEFNQPPAGLDIGRNDQFTEGDHQRYWSISAEKRQAMLRETYNQRNPTDPYATSRDHNQRELEITAIKRSLTDKKDRVIVDLGCGNGHTLISLGKEFTGAKLRGVDFADKLIDGARELTKRAKGELKSVPEFECDDAIAFVKRLGKGSVDCIITERFLLNLPDEETQQAVLRDIFGALVPGGQLLMCEGSLEGFRALNELRIALGLEPIAETSAENVSSRRFDDKSIERFATENVGFHLKDKMGFTTFFAISRGLYPALIAPQRPTFHAKINELARSLQENMPFTPGLGSNVLWVLNKPVDR